jgi:ATP-dependent Clp protease ATP-binding subunit ClpC
MFEKLTYRARRVVTGLAPEPKIASEGYIGAEHILAGLIREVDGVAATALQALGIGLKEAASMPRTSPAAVRAVA